MYPSDTPFPGSAKERAIYDGMNAIDLIDRLLTKRCASYFGRNENYLLVSGASGWKGDFSKVGTHEETPPLVMEDCLTRDEIKLAGFILISSKITKVVKEKSWSVVMMGIPFPILNREGQFDWEDVMITRRQNIREKGFGPATTTTPTDAPVDSELHCKRSLKAIWANFYGHKAILFSALNRNKGHGRFHRNPRSCRAREEEEEAIRNYYKLPHTTFMDTSNLVVRLSVITLGIFAEANKRAQEEHKMAYIVIDKNSENICFG